MLLVNNIFHVIKLYYISFVKINTSTDIIIYIIIILKDLNKDTIIINHMESHSQPTVTLNNGLKMP